MSNTPPFKLVPFFPMIKALLLTQSPLTRMPIYSNYSAIFVSESGGSPIPLLKTASRKSNWPFLASRKFRKTASRSKKKVRNHVSRKNVKAKSYSRCTNISANTMAVITKMYLNISVAFSFSLFFFSGLCD